MRHLLDVNLLIAGIVQSHSQHAQAHVWLAATQIALCPIVELGFLRITTNNRSGIGLTMEQARERLERFAALRQADRIPDDLPALASRARTHDQVTDHYLADLAARHGFKLATFDSQINHPSVELVS
jgi:toxin-antitoxin system PIN domain toxin